MCAGELRISGAEGRSLGLGFLPRIATQNSLAAMAMVIDRPTLGTLNLQGEQAAPLLASDLNALGRFFSKTVTSSQEVPQCAVLFLYATLDADGRVAGTELTLARIVAQSGAKIVIVAPETPRQSRTKRLLGDKIAADLVITLDRKGDKFASFFAKIFDRMNAGLALPMAWVEIFPQVRDSPAAADAPDTVFVMGPAPVRFAPRPQP